MSTPASAGERFALARLIAAHICLHACMAGMRMAAPLLALREGFSASAVGVLLALFALSQIFLALPAGRYADRHGVRRPVRLGVAMAVLGAGAAVPWPTFGVLCAAALLTGGATGTVSIALQRHVGRAAHDAVALKRVFGWLSIGPAIANFVGPLSAGLLIDHAGVWLGGQPADRNGYRAAFAVMALLPLLTWLLVRRARELPRAQPPADQTPRRATDLLRQPMMRRLLLVNWCLAACWDAHTFVVPLLGHERGFSASAIGTVLGSFAVAAALVRMAMPLLAERAREWVVISGAMLLTGVLLAVYPLMPTALAMGACSVLLGLALGVVQPMIMSTLHQITPSDRQGEALGLRLMSLNGSGVLMPMVFGALGAAIGISAVFWLVGAGVGLGARLAWKLRA